MRRLMILALACVVLAASGADCLLPGDLIDNAKRKALRGFSSGNELRSYLASQARQGDRYLWREGFLGGGMMDFVPAPMATQGDFANGAAEDDGGGVSFSTTNVQEEGVDESDIVKNDADHTLNDLLLSTGSQDSEFGFMPSLFVHGFPYGTPHVFEILSVNRVKKGPRLYFRSMGRQAENPQHFF